MLSTVDRIRAKLPFASYSPEERKIIAVCCGIAFFFWLLVKLSKDYVLNEVLELTYELPMGRAFSSEPPQQVSVELKGTGWSLLAARLPARQLQLQLPVGEGGVYTLTPFEVESSLSELLGRRVAIQQLNLSTVRIPLETRTQVRVPVLLQQEFSFEPGFSLISSVELEPDSVSVEGPESKLADLRFVLTDSLRTGPLRKSLEQQLSLRQPLPGLRIFPSEVTVRIPVEQITEKTLYVPVQIVNAPTTDSIRIFPDKAYVKCLLGLSRYGSLSASDFVLIANFEEAYLKDGRNSVPLELRGQPDYVRNVSYSPAAAEFFIVEQPGPSEPQ